MRNIYQYPEAPAPYNFDNVRTPRPEDPGLTFEGYGIAAQVLNFGSANDAAAFILSHPDDPTLYTFQVANGLPFTGRAGDYLSPLGYGPNTLDLVVARVQSLSRLNPEQTLVSAYLNSSISRDTALAEIRKLHPDWVAWQVQAWINTLDVSKGTYNASNDPFAGKGIPVEPEPGPGPAGMPHIPTWLWLAAAAGAAVLIFNRQSTPVLRRA